jgi:hypothetical protein
MSGKSSFFLKKLKIKMRTFILSSDALLSNTKRLGKYFFMSQLIIIPIAFYFQPVNRI